MCNRSTVYNLTIKKYKLCSVHVPHVTMKALHTAAANFVPFQARSRRRFSSRPLPPHRFLGPMPPSYLTVHAAAAIHPPHTWAEGGHPESNVRRPESVWHHHHKQSPSPLPVASPPPPPRDGYLASLAANPPPLLLIWRWWWWARLLRPLPAWEKAKKEGYVMKETYPRTLLLPPPFFLKKTDRNFSCGCTRGGKFQRRLYHRQKQRKPKGFFFKLVIVLV